MRHVDDVHSLPKIPVGLRHNLHLHPQNIKGKGYRITLTYTKAIRLLCTTPRPKKTGVDIDVVVEDGKETVLMNTTEIEGVVADDGRMIGVIASQDWTKKRRRMRRKRRSLSWESRTKIFGG